MTWTGHVARVGETRNAYNTVVEEPEGKRLFGRPKRRWEDNIRVGYREIWWESVDWMHLAQDGDCWQALVSTVVNLGAP